MYQFSTGKMFYPGQFRLKFNRDQLWHPLIGMIQPKAKDFVIMLSTGWKDMDGKEVFQGDIVNFAGIEVEIVFENGKLGDKHGHFNFTKEGMAVFGKVVRNIYEITNN